MDPSGACALHLLLDLRPQLRAGKLKAKTGRDRGARRGHQSTLQDAAEYNTRSQSQHDRQEVHTQRLRDNPAKAKGRALKQVAQGTGEILESCKNR